eukprot:Unigene12434_Nuclearia_a/m.37784 Unigene12434_Nuclearia_a/g.37784  ORF Unigene12434_Nuclearia_a/g.37784 Unigene12434_Nuclearia_a/m.37784 type:complete len:219 (+) Unigene12434_Nuclearia_a:444-1100(+)
MSSATEEMYNQTLLPTKRTSPASEDAFDQTLLPVQRTPSSATTDDAAANDQTLLPLSWEAIEHARAAVLVSAPASAVAVETPTAVTPLAEHAPAPAVLGELDDPDSSEPASALPDATAEELAHAEAEAAEAAARAKARSSLYLAQTAQAEADDEREEAASVLELATALLDEDGTRIVSVGTIVGTGPELARLREAARRAVEEERQMAELSTALSGATL